MKNVTKKPVGVFIIAICVMISCSTKHGGLISNKRGHAVFAIMPIVKHDTIVKPALPRKQLTSAQMQDYLRPFYQANFDQLFAPEFQRLGGIIEKQAISLKTMSEYMVETRRRADSIIKERNYYRQKDVKATEKELAYQKESLRLANKLIKMQREKSMENDSQIRINSIMAISCLIGVSFIAILFFGLQHKINKLSKKFDEAFKNTTHV